MHILLTGGTGFIGQALVPHLQSMGHTVTIYSRQRRSSTAQLAYIKAFDELPQLEPIDTVINLAGESLAGGRWTKTYKQKLRESRIDLTYDLIQALRRSGHRPDHFISASAIGWYGNCGAKRVTESHPAGSGFGAELCKDWEAVASSAKETLGAMVTQMRIGVVLDRDGGAFPQIFMPFRFGVANWPGTGNQYLSWIHRSDLIHAIGELVQRSVEGPVNLTAPEPVTYKTLADEISKLKRTWIQLPAPAVIMQLALGEMASELLLNGQRVIPAKLEAKAFVFQYPAINQALTAILSN
ncbi:MAG: TIGR01777 family oxidoreductase [Halieaceae bacterium]|nr:TIGR01777 family oxidoreductase [Halieaceae bacterium]